MGYYATSIEGAITISPENKDKALQAVVRAYIDYNASTSWGELPIPTSLEEELDSEGFGFEIFEDNFVITNFDGKWRLHIEKLLEALLSVATPTSALAFRGEDGEMWRMTPAGTQNATIVWQ